MRRTLAVVALLVAGTLLVVLAGTPVHLGYDGTAGTPPEIGPQDGYVAVQPSEPTVGDVVVFRSESGDYLARKVVDTTPDGVVVADSATDGAGRTTVPNWRVAAEVAVVVGHLVVLPGFGRLVPALQAAQRLLPAAVALLVVAGAVAVGRSRRGRRRRGAGGRDAHDRRRGQSPGVTERGATADGPAARLRRGLRVALVVGVLAVAAVTAVGATTFTVADAPGDDGQAATTTLTAETPLPARLLHYVVEADGVTVTDAGAGGGGGDSVGDGTDTAGGSDTLGAGTYTVEITVPDNGEAARDGDGTADGTERGTVSLVPYLAVLPPATLRALHAVHPVVAVAGTVLAVFGPPVALAVGLRRGRALLAATTREN